MACELVYITKLVFLNDVHDSHQNKQQIIKNGRVISILFTLQPIQESWHYRAIAVFW